jgi:sirohydrochlorin cobaltochelatase
MVTANQESQDVAGELEALEAKANAVLPPQFECFEAVSPTSMGSAGLKYGSDGRVAWDQIWTHFCDLALAGGPPHRGTLLEVSTIAEVEYEPAGYQVVCEEIVRGIKLTSGLHATPTSEVGWIAVQCVGEAMAAWLLRAVMAENVFARRLQDKILVPAGPHFRPAKEVKNVVVALAKTSHYWEGHISDSQRSAAANLFTANDTAVLLEPPSRPEVLAHPAEYQQVSDHLSQAIGESLSLPTVQGSAVGWLGIKFPDERTAGWFVRTAIAENILARREENVLYLPIPLYTSKNPLEVITRITQLNRLWQHGNRKA